MDGNILKINIYTQNFNRYKNMRIPLSVDNLTLEQYIELKKIESSNLDEIDKGTQILSLVSGISLDEIDTMPAFKLEGYGLRLSRLRNSKPTQKINRYLWIDGKRYKAMESEHKMSFNQFTSADTFATNELSNYHLLAAVVYVHSPLFGKSTHDDLIDKSNVFLKQKVKDVFGAVFFCSNRLETLKEDSKRYLKRSEKLIADRWIEMKKEVSRLNLNMDGFMSLTKSQQEAILNEMK